MAEPLSIIVGLASLISVCLKVSRGVKTVAEKYQAVNNTLSALSVECSVTSAALSQIEQMLAAKQASHLIVSQDRSEIRLVLELALSGCAATFAVLDQELNKFERSRPSGNRLGFKTRTKYLWNEDTLKEVLQQMRDQRSSINFLIDVIQTLVPPVFFPSNSRRTLWCTFYFGPSALV